MKPINLILGFIFSILSLSGQYTVFEKYQNIFIPTFDTSQVMNSQHMLGQPMFYFKQPVRFAIQSNHAGNADIMLYHLVPDSEGKIKQEKLTLRGTFDYRLTPPHVVAVRFLNVNSDKTDYYFSGMEINGKFYVDTLVVRDTINQFIDTCINKIYVNNYVENYIEGYVEFKIDTCTGDTLQNDTTITDTIVDTTGKDTVYNTILDTRFSNEINPYINSTNEFLMFGTNIDKYDVYSIGTGKKLPSFLTYTGNKNSIYIGDGISSGIYVVIMYHKDKIYSHKFVKL